LVFLFLLVKCNVSTFLTPRLNYYLLKIEPHGIILWKLTVSQLVKKLSTLCAIRNFITMISGTSYLSPFLSEVSQSAPSFPVSFTYIYVFPDPFQFSVRSPPYHQLYALQDIVPVLALYSNRCRGTARW
jgi:hypothetical protein